MNYVEDAKFCAFLVSMARVHKQFVQRNARKGKKKK